MSRIRIPRASLTIALAVTVLWAGLALAQNRQRQPQPRPHGEKVAIDPSKVRVGDGDTVILDWGEGDLERVRILGIDTPETRNEEYNLPYAQPFGYEAAAFAHGAFAVASKIDVLRAGELDPYGRTLGYFFLDDKNYSVLIILAGLAAESVTRYGDNGFPDQAQAVIEAAREAGPTPFEPPGEYRRRMRELTEFMKKKGTYPPH